MTSFLKDVKRQSKAGLSKHKTERQAPKGKKLERKRERKKGGQRGKTPTQALLKETIKHPKAKKEKRNNFKASSPHPHPKISFKQAIQRKMKIQTQSKP